MCALCIFFLHLDVCFNMPYLRPSDTIMSDEPDYSQLPLGERLVHKVWKVRAGAYDEVVKAIETSMDADSIAKEHLPLMKKMVMDSNVMAQGKGIAAGKRVHATECPLLSDDTLGLSSLPPSSTFPATIARYFFLSLHFKKRWNVYTKKTSIYRRCDIPLSFRVVDSFLFVAGCWCAPSNLLVVCAI